MLVARNKRNSICSQAPKRQLFSIRNGLLSLAAAVTLGALASCATLSNKTKPKEVEYQHEAATFTLAVTTVKSWSSYASLLSPNFKLTGDQAAEKVIPHTSRVQEINVSRRNISAKFGLPGTSDTSTETTTSTSLTEGSASTESSTLSSTDVSSKAPGTLPTDTPSIPAGVGGSPSTSTMDLAQSDPLLRYSAATALYQEVQLLNRYVKDAAIKKGYEPYIVRMQLGVFPHKRRMPYDAYVTMSFFPEFEADGTGCEDAELRHTCKSEPAIAIPLLVTDSLEGAHATRTDEMVRQLGFAINALAGNVVGGIGFGRRNNEYNGYIGTDLNSTFTIGRISDGAIKLRLGAVRQSSDTFSMVTRNHHITMLVMVPKSIIDPKNANDELYKNIKSTVNVRGYTELRHTENKARSPKHRSRSDEYRALAKNILPRFIAQDSAIAKEGKCGKGKISIPIKGGSKRWGCVSEASISTLQRHVVKNQFKDFANDFTALLGTGTSSAPREAWLMFSEELSRREFIGASFEIPRNDRLKMPKPLSDIL